MRCRWLAAACLVLVAAAATPAWGQEAVLVIIDAASPIAAFDGAAVVASIVQSAPGASACSWTQGPYGGTEFYVRMLCPDLSLATEAAGGARRHLPSIYTVRNVTLEAPLPRYATREWKPESTPLIVASVVSGIIASAFIAVFIYMVRRTDRAPVDNARTDVETQLLDHTTSSVEPFDCE